MITPINKILLKCFQDAAKRGQGDQVCLVCRQTLGPWSQEVKVHTSVLPPSRSPHANCWLTAIQGHPVPVPIVDWLDRTTHPTFPSSMAANCRYNLFYTLSKLSAEWQVCTQATPIKSRFNSTSIEPFKLYYILAFSISLDLLTDQA